VARQLSKTRRCTSCELPTTDSIVIAGLRLPYHAACARQARRDAAALLAGIDFASLAARHRGPCGGALPRVDAIDQRRLRDRSHGAIKRRGG
jgi:hypothetical protein